MAIKHIRIDERLVHGQVASAWSNKFAANRMMVVNNAANADDFMKQMLRIATPAAMALSVLTYDKARERIMAGQYDNDSVFVVMKSVGDAAEFYNSGYHFDAINIGNISKKGDAAEQISTGIFLNPEDKKAIEVLKGHGVKVTVQMTPNDDVIVL